MVSSKEGMVTDEENKERIKKAIEKTIIDIKKNFSGTETRFIETEFSNFLKSKVDWRKILRKRLKNTFEKITSGLEYHKRKSYIVSEWLKEDVIYFKYKQKKMAKLKVLIVVDTSSSIDDKTLHQFVSEVYYIVTSFDAEVTLIQHDVEIKNIAKLSKKNINKIKVFGRGGTSHKEVLEYLHSLDKKEKRHSVVVFLSDFISDLTNKDIEELRKDFADVILVDENLRVLNGL